jgi:hypothetical protein
MDKELNKRADVPIFDIDDTGRVDLTLWKMDTGFLLTDNDNKKEHSISNMDDFQASLELLIESIKTKVRNLMNDKGKFEFVDIAFIIMEGEAEADKYGLDAPVLPETLELSPDQLADIINSIYEEGPLHNFPMRGQGRNVRHVSAEAVMQAINSPQNVIRLKTRLKNPDDKYRSGHTANRPVPEKKKFYSDQTKNKDQHKHKDNQNKDKPEPNKID